MLIEKIAKVVLGIVIMISIIGSIFFGASAIGATSEWSGLSNIILFIAFIGLTSMLSLKWIHISNKSDTFTDCVKK